MSAKIKTRQGIVRLVRNLKRRGKIVVTVNGSFDIIHPGHIDLLKQAKSKGDILIVFLNSDKSVRLYKGFLRPVNSEKARAEVLAAIKYVDYVATFDEINPKKILAEIRPDIHCNGSDWGKNCIEREVVEKYGVWAEKSMYGKKYMGTLRTSFLINPKGRIEKIYEAVKPAEHSREVLKDLKNIIK